MLRKDSSSKDLGICSGFVAVVHVALKSCSVLFFGQAVNICRWVIIR